ncbi:MAG: AAA family ATPase [Candidatus Acidiferrales bacterium]
MRITTLTLRNFRSHEDTILDLDRLNFVRGPNGSGKSSIQMALEYLFTGRCELTDAVGRGAEALIRSGEKELEVSAILESGEIICRRRSLRSKIVEINGKRVPVDAAETFLAKQFGSADVLSAVLNADRFVEMSETEQQRLLVQLVDAGKLDIPEEICDALRAVHEEPPKLASVGDVEAAHQRFYELRTQVTRALKGLGQMEKPSVPSDLPSVQEIRNKLEELRQQKERFVAQKAEADVCWRNAQARLKQVRAEIEEVSSEILDPKQEQELLRLESLREHAERLRQELAELLAEQRTVEAACATVQGMMGKCPTCHQAISDGAKARGLERLRGRLADFEGLIQGTREELNEYRDLEMAASRVESHRQALARRGKLLEEQSKIQAVQKPNAADLDSRMAILSERINKGERVLERAQQIHSNHERWEAHIREKSSLKARIAPLDRLIEFLGPNGAMMEQGRSRVVSFIESLNGQLATFGYTCNFILEPFEIRITPHGGSGLTLMQLSESERFRFSIAFQIALGTVTRLRFVVIDRADLLDMERRRLLTGLLVNSQLDQVIVLATGEGGAPPLVPQGVKFFALSEEPKVDRVLASATG